MDEREAPGGDAKVFFPNLNGLRFLAALGVVASHIAFGKAISRLPSPELNTAVVHILGAQGVEFFFVLSGFLITFLLLEEERRTGTIRVGRFYARRALRIWPLYYIILALGLYLLPPFDFFSYPGHGQKVVQSHLLLQTLLYGTFFSNLAYGLHLASPLCGQIWSIGTEEQFYFLWPVLVRRVRPKILLMVAVIGVYMLGVIVVWRCIGQGPWQTWVRAFYGDFNIDCMAMGGLAAVILHRRPRWLPWLINLPLFFAALAATLCLAIRGVAIPYVYVQVYAVLFAVLLLNFAANPRLRAVLEFRPMPYLGQLSYGIYMWHLIVASFWLHLLVRWGLAEDAVVYPTVALTSIGAAALSYRFIESPFLRKKERLAVVPSGAAS